MRTVLSLAVILALAVIAISSPRPGTVQVTRADGSEIIHAPKALTQESDLMNVPLEWDFSLPLVLSRVDGHWVVSQ